MKIKAMIPSMREKKRYIAFEVLSDRPVSREDAVREIKATMAKFIGELGMAKAGVIFLPDWSANKGVFRVGNRHVDEAKAALALVKAIGGASAIVKSVGVSGILNKSRKKYIGG
ncbi:MAG TPA: hypothetical protein HA362_07540 [Nanoarchaeota archaeon]|nr:hypothetical protein [Nanoarchaeota archaeon]